jgi:hypothetical protein
VYDLHTFEPVVKGTKNMKKSKTTRIYCKYFNKQKYFNKNQGGVKVVAGSKLSLVSGNYHEPEEPYGVILASAKAEIRHVFEDTF